MKAVVTGGAGFIGAHLCDALVADGVAVSTIDNGRSGDWSRLESDPERVDADIAELGPSEWDELLRGADVVFHLAAEKYNSSRTTPQRVIDTNISATSELSHAAARQGAKVVFTSSLYAYGSLGPAAMRETDVPLPRTMYGMSKLAGEGILRSVERDAGLRWAVARLFFVYGPRQFAEGGYRSVILTHMDRIARGENPRVNGDGEQGLDYVYVDDVVRALRQLAEPTGDGLIVNVGSGVATSVNDLTEAIIEVTGSGLTSVPAPEDWTAGTSRFSDCSLIEQKLGWRASMSLHDGLNLTWKDRS